MKLLNHFRDEHVRRRLDTAADIVTSSTSEGPHVHIINTNAGSAGAIIAIATQHIFMAPVSAIGAPLNSSYREDLPATAKEKRFRTGLHWSVVPRQERP